ncbi:MAG: methyl-accepting chemotaxis protein, partial [Planctomycetota bacterium]
TANENFLQTLGYGLLEIQGQHHNMFVESAYGQSAEYREFWAKLNRGEYQAAEYKRIGKGGKEVWIQASYNPIMGLNGKPAKVVKYATEVTEQKLVTADFEGQLAAIGKSQAVIEFEMDGTIITANENFLQTLGYGLAEVQGQHHSMFVEGAYGHSPEYREFWAKLNRGEYQAAEYKRIGKGGKEVWIQASYNPILDLNGKPAKVVKYATNITPQKLEEDQKKLANEAIVELVEAANAGNLAKRADASKFTGNSEVLVKGVNEMLDAIIAPINEISEVMGKVAVQDLRARMAGDYKGDLETIKVNTNEALNTLESALCQVSDATGEVSSASLQISEGSLKLAEGANIQAASIEQISASLEEMTSMTSQNADNALQAKNLANSATDSAAKGDEQMAIMKEAIDAIKKSSDETARIVKTIDEISFQTNMLALNAAVEAARAGDAGKGFAVVAEEVRSLAQRSAEAAKNTAVLIEGSGKNVDKGVKLTDDVQNILREITEGNNKVNDLIAEISAASTEQADGVAQVTTAVDGMNKVTQENAASSEESSAAATQLNGQVAQLRDLVQEFELTGNPGAAQQRVGPRVVVSNTPEGKPARRFTPAKTSVAFPLNDDELTDF